MDDDVLAHLFSFFDFPNLVLAGRVCQRWRNVARLDPLVGTRRADLCSFPRLPCEAYDAFLSAWGRRVRELEFVDDNVYTIPRSLNLELAAPHLVHLDTLEVNVCADDSHPCQFPWLLVLGRASVPDAAVGVPHV